MRIARAALLSFTLALGACDAAKGGEGPRSETSEPPGEGAELDREEKGDDLMPMPAQDEAECGDATACLAKAQRAQRDGDIAGAIELFQTACGLGAGAACHQLGQLYRDGRGVELDDRRASELFSQGCALGSALACDAAGH